MIEVWGITYFNMPSLCASSVSLDITMLVVYRIYCQPNSVTSGSRAVDLCANEYRESASRGMIAQ